jgi:hypothetical protein
MLAKQIYNDAELYYKNFGKWWKKVQKLIGAVIDPYDDSIQPMNAHESFENGMTPEEFVAELETFV